MKLLTSLKLKYSAFKVRRAERHAVKEWTKTICFCTKYMNKYHVPLTRGQYLVMSAAFSVYDESITALNKMVETYRKRVAVYEEDNK